MTGASNARLSFPAIGPYCTASKHFYRDVLTQEASIQAMFTTILLSKIRSYFKYRETVRELSRLTDRELEDLGIARFQIDGIARGVRTA